MFIINGCGFCQFLLLHLLKWLCGFYVYPINVKYCINFQMLICIPGLNCLIMLFNLLYIAELFVLTLRILVSMLMRYWSIICVISLSSFWYQINTGFEEWIGKHFPPLFSKEYLKDSVCAFGRTQQKDHLLSAFCKKKTKNKQKEKIDSFYF